MSTYFYMMIKMMNNHIRSNKSSQALYMYFLLTRPVTSYRCYGSYFQKSKMALPAREVVSSTARNWSWSFHSKGWAPNPKCHSVLLLNQTNLKYPLKHTRTHARTHTHSRKAKSRVSRYPPERAVDVVDSTLRSTQTWRAEDCFAPV